MFDSTTLLDYAGRLGFTLTPHGDATYRATVPSAEGDVALLVRLSPDWLLVSVVPFLQTRGQVSLDLSRWLLRMNRDLMMGKFAYDTQGDVVLDVELPTESLDFSECEKAFRSAVDGAVKHRAILRQANGG